MPIIIPNEKLNTMSLFITRFYNVEKKHRAYVFIFSASFYVMGKHVLRDFNLKFEIYVVKGDITHNRIYVGITSEAIKFVLLILSQFHRFFYEYT